MPSCRFPVFLSALALLGVLKLRSSLSLGVFLIGHFCPIIGLVVSYVSHMRTPAVSSRADTSCVLSEKTKTIKINNLLFISILFYENQQTTPKFKVAPSLRSGILRSGFAIGDRVSGLTLTIKMPVALYLVMARVVSHHHDCFSGFRGEAWTDPPLAECILAN